MRRIISWIPNSITCCNLVSGCIAMFMALQDPGWIWGGLESTQWCYIFILAASLFDFLDGMVARLLKQYSPLGKELDSLSDLVSFGVAPSMLMIKIMLSHDMRGLAWAALAIPILGAIRLARFNIDDSQSHTFKGLPIPANALFWIGFSGLIHPIGFSGLIHTAPFYPGNIAVALIILIIASAMVWPLKMFSLKFKTFGFRENVKRYGIVIATILFVVFYGISGLAWSIIMYILISALSRHHDD